MAPEMRLILTSAKETFQLNTCTMGQNEACIADSMMGWNNNGNDPPFSFSMMREEEELLEGEDSTVWVQ